MSGRIPREFIDELLVRVDIVDVIDSHVPLKKAGANFIARCPFHTEKTPSFSVNPNKQFFHCFGCGASGNAIGFLMDYRHLDFVEAVEELATFAGLDVPRENEGSQSGKRDKGELSALYGLMERVALLYAEQLRNHDVGGVAAAYLESRGISDESAQDFLLGYAPDEWRFLASRFDQQALIAAGLLVSKDGAPGYDRFRGRIVYPIRDKRARIIGFGGRVLDDSLPKYLNSPETVLFHKGKEVYGLYELLEKSSKPERIVLVEGYMDVIAMAQHGIHYAVAVLGTAATLAHLDLLFKVSPELVFCFDGDKAGRDAAWRVMESAFSSLKEGRQIKVMLLPDKQDPDSLLRDEGAGAFVQRIEDAQALSDYFFAQVRSGLNLQTMEGRAQLVTKARPYLEKVPQGIFKDMMLSNLERLSEAKIASVFANPATLSSQRGRRRQVDAGWNSSARFAIALLIQNPKLARLAEQKDIDWEGLEFPGIDIFKNVLQEIDRRQVVNTALLLELYRNTGYEKAVNALAFLDLLVPEDGVEAQFLGALERLLAQAREATIERLLAKGRDLDLQEKEVLRKMLADNNLPK